MPKIPDSDPFADARRDDGVLDADFGGERIPVLLRYRDVREAAKDFSTFSSDAPCRVPIPAEHESRSFRQLPIETDPPDHGEYRRLVEPFFRQPLQREYASKIEALVDAMLIDATGKPSIEFVQEFALPLQSRALTYLLKVPMAEADTWISWGANVLYGEDIPIGEKGANLVRYIHDQIDRAIAAPGDDIFSALNEAEFRGRRLTREEIAGFVHLAFAGGRDTVINMLTGVSVYFAANPEELARIRSDEQLISTATEEFVRALSPLTLIARVCPHGADARGEKISPDGRAALCWASANFDETVFDAPDEVRIERMPNPHVGFGSGTHKCLGAPQARAIVRSYLKRLAARVERIEAKDGVRQIERNAKYERKTGYERTTVKFVPR